MKNKYGIDVTLQYNALVRSAVALSANKSPSLEGQLENQYIDDYRAFVRMCEDNEDLLSNHEAMRVFYVHKRVKDSEEFALCFSRLIQLQFELVPDAGVHDAKQEMNDSDFDFDFDETCISNSSYAAVGLRLQLSAVEDVGSWIDEPDDERVHYPTPVPSLAESKQRDSSTELSHEKEGHSLT